MNPQLANMTDQQIRQAAMQMEMMANNPSMMKAAMDQMKNMNPEQVRQMQAQMQQPGGPPSASSRNATMNATTGSTPLAQTVQQAQQAADMMANMTPEQMKDQARMLRTMDPDLVRRTNPQLAHMTNEQILAAAAQFEMLADNPQMMEMAMKQMKNMTPEQMEAIRNGTIPPGPGGTGPANMMGDDPAKMLASMDKTQLKQMLQSVRDNPEMLKQFAAMSGVSEEQFKQGVDAFAGMSDAKLDAALKMMQTAQKAKEKWTEMNAKTGGHLPKMLIGAGALFAMLIIWYLFFRTSPSIVPADIPDLGREIPDANIVQEEDEFASEF
jgi:hypothetical protein